MDQTTKRLVSIGAIFALIASGFVVIYAPAQAAVIEDTVSCDTLDITTTNVVFRGFNPCTGTLEDADTENTDDAFDYIGSITALSALDVWTQLVSISGTVTRTQDDVDQRTTFSYTVNNFYSEAEGAEVDVNVLMTFDGNTVRWEVSAFEPGTSTPASITFKIEADLGSDSNRIDGDSDGYEYFTDDSMNDPALVFNSQSTWDVINDTESFGEFLFDGGLTSGFVEVTIIGYERCATEDQIIAGVESFTSAYEANKYSDIADLDGTCARSCKPSSKIIQTSPGNFNVGGVDICFDNGYESIDPEVLLDQVNGIADIGSNVPLEFSVDYQDVAVGSDKSLNAILTIVETVGLEGDIVESVDELDSPNDSWVNSYINVIEASADNDRYLTYELYFYDSEDETKTAVSISNLELNTYDIDNYQFFEVNSVKSSKLSSDTILTVTKSGDVIRALDETGIGSESGNESRVSVKFSPTDYIYLKMGVSNLEPEDSDAWFGLDFSSGPSWKAPKFSDGPTATASKVLIAKKKIDSFLSDSPKLLASQKVKIRKFINKHPSINFITCKGYTAGAVKQADKALAKARATNVCDVIKAIKPSVSILVKTKIPGLPLSPKNRKVVIRGYEIG